MPQVDVELLRNSGSALPEDVRAPAVPEVPLNFVGEDWVKIDSGFWNRSESIPVLEGRSIVWALQHLSRSSKNHGKRHLIPH